MTDSPIAPPPRRWEEPNASLVLRFGTYRSRQLAGLALLCLGGLLVLPARVNTIDLAFVGSVMHVAGWVVLPAGGWRRIVAAGPSMLALWATVLGARLVFILAVPLLLWLVVRRRPLPTYVVVALPVVANLLALEWFGIFDRPRVVLIGAASVVLGAWAAAFASRVLGSSSKAR